MSSFAGKWALITGAVFDAPESGLYRYAQSGLELARRDISRCRTNSAAVGAKRTWRTSSQGLWVHGL